MIARLSSRQGQAGFSLVEMLLAFTLMAMLLGLAYGGFRAASRAADSGQEALEHSGSIRTVHQFIRRQLNQMLPLAYGTGDDTGQERIVFEGDAGRIQFVAPMPGYLGQGGPQVQYLEVVPGEEGFDLLFGHQLLQGYDPLLMTEREPIVLLEGVESAQFEFLSTDETGTPIAWTGAWDTPHTLPRAVRLDIALPEGRSQVWPLLVAGARVDGAASAQAGNEQDYGNAVRSLISRSSERRR